MNIRLPSPLCKVEQIVNQAENAKLGVQDTKWFSIVHVGRPALRLNWTGSLGGDIGHDPCGLKPFLHSNHQGKARRQVATRLLVSEETLLVLLSPGGPHLKRVVQIKRTGNENRIPFQNTDRAISTAKLEKDSRHT